METEQEIREQQRMARSQQKLNGSEANQLDHETKMQIATAQLLQDPCVKGDLGKVWKSSVNKNTVVVTEDLDESHPKIGKRCMKMV